MKTAGQTLAPTTGFRHTRLAPSLRPPRPTGGGTIAVTPQRSRRKGMPSSPPPAAAAAAPVASAAAATAERDEDADPSMLAPRSARARQPALSYFAAFIKASADLWSPEDNPDGYVVISVAENRLSKKTVADALAAAPRPADDALGYQNFRGIDPLRASLAAVMQRTLLLRRRRGRRNGSLGREPGDAAGDDGGGAARQAEDGANQDQERGGGGDDKEDEDDDNEDDDQEEEQERRLLARDMFLACGAGSVVDLLFHLVASPGDGALIPAPYYPAFDNDLAVRDAVVPVPVFLDLEDGVDRSPAWAAGYPGPWAAAAGAPPPPPPPPSSSSSPSSSRPRLSLSEQLEAAARAWEAEAAARQQGPGATGPPPRVRALLLTNPSNPLGTVLRRGQLLEAALWAHERGVHLVCDEIYGAMVWGEEEEEEEEEGEGGDGACLGDKDDDRRFVSAWRLLTGGAFARQLARKGGAEASPSPAEHGTVLEAHQRRAETLTHVVWGLSKDFCASGLRVGVLLSRNPGVAAAWGNLSYFAGVGFPLQHALAHVLSDGGWVEKFWRDNRAALRASWRELGAALDAARIPYVRGARGAMFCWVDLREGLLPTADAAAVQPAQARGAEGGGGGGAGSASPAHQDWEAERALWRAIVRDARVVVTPGEACHAPEPGFFRVCWAWMPREALPVAVSRIRAVLDARKGKY